MENPIYRQLKNKILDPDAFAAKALEQKKLGKKTVFTNGCFDILHNGHVQYLAEAKSLGDLLFVALNTDLSVQSLKGKERPINSLPERLENLAALFMVDYLTFFGEDTPYQLIAACLPSILVKGGDYPKEKIVGWDLVEKNGGTVQTLLYIPGKSTSSIVAKIRA